jgi:hypothetical protein
MRSRGNDAVGVDERVLDVDVVRDGDAGAARRPVDVIVPVLRPVVMMVERAHVDVGRLATGVVMRDQRRPGDERAREKAREDDDREAWGRAHVPLRG